METEAVEVSRPVSKKPFSVGLVVLSRRNGSQGFDQATNLGLMITRSGRVANLVILRSSPEGGIGGLRGLLRYVHDLMGVIKGSELIHLMAGSYLELLRKCRLEGWERLQADGKLEGVGGYL